MRKICLIFITIILSIILSGCCAIHQIHFAEITATFPAPYQSGMTVQDSAEKELDFEIVGEGYGTSVGYSVILGLVYYQSPDHMKAYQEAVNKQGGDFLIESRTQIVTTGILSPFIFSRGEFRI